MRKFILVFLLLCSMFTEADEAGLPIETVPIISDMIGKVGENRVPVPKYYYRVISSEKHKNMVAFVIPKAPLDQSLKYYIVKVDITEAQTTAGEIDYNNFISNKPSYDNRCKAMTQKGTRCKRNVEGDSNFCWQHK